MLGIQHLKIGSRKVKHTVIPHRNGYDSNFTSSPGYMACTCASLYSVCFLWICLMHSLHILQGKMYCMHTRYTRLTCVTHGEYYVRHLSLIRVKKLCNRRQNKNVECKIKCCKSMSTLREYLSYQLHKVVMLLLQTYSAFYASPVLTRIFFIRSSILYLYCTFP
jgi:hypothetical protein